MALTLEPWQWTAAAVGVTTLAALALRRPKKPAGGGLKRRMSFTSQAMVIQSS
jgi:hypothetical protein